MAQSPKPDYSALTAAELIADVQRQPIESREEAVQSALAQRAADLVLAPKAVQQYDPATWRALLQLVEYRVARLTKEQRQQFAALSAQLAPLQNGEDWGAIRARVIVLRAAGDPTHAVPQVIENWVKSRHVESLTLDETAWALRESLPGRAHCNKFTVVWSGFVTAPRSGDYSFFVSPINVNSASGSRGVRHSVLVSLGDRTIIDAGPHSTAPAAQANKSPAPESQSIDRVAWNWKSGVIPLQGGQATPLRVEMTYQCAEPALFSPPHAILSWEGPGIDRQVIGNEFLSTPEKANKGLLAEYQFTVNGSVETVRQTSTSIDYAWRTSADAAPVNERLTQQLSDQLWNLAIDQNYLARCAAGQARHVYFQDDASVEYLSSAQRREFLRLVNNSAAWLTRIDPSSLVHLYRNLRFGNSELATDLVGRTLQLHADLTPEITSDFYQANRQPYAQLGYLMAVQQPDQFHRLEDRYLQMPDGRCALPVAYTLSYGHAASSQMAQENSLLRERRERPGPGPRPVSERQEWLTVLDSKLADDKLAGDARVNWLLARAQAAEATGHIDPNATHVTTELFAGRQWLEEGRLVAQSDSVRTRLLEEWIARYAARGQWPQAEEEIKAHPSTTLAAQWQAQLESVKAQAAARAAAEKRQTQAIILAEYQRRQKQAFDRGDKSSGEQYSARIKLLQEASNNDNSKQR